MATRFPKQCLACKMSGHGIVEYNKTIIFPKDQNNPRYGKIVCKNGHNAKYLPWPRWKKGYAPPGIEQYIDTNRLWECDLDTEGFRGDIVKALMYRNVLFRHFEYVKQDSIVLMMRSVADPQWFIDNRLVRSPKCNFVWPKARQMNGYKEQHAQQR